MKRLFKLILLSTASAAYSLAAFQPGRAQELKFEHLTDADGLSQNAVFCILQDRKGFMWFGTQDGLNRFDGYAFTVFRHDPAVSNSISDNYITALYEDRQGKLWIGTHNGGLNRFDPLTETFASYCHDPQNPASLSHNRVSSINEDTDALWVGTHGGLNRLNRTRNRFTRFLHDPQQPESLSDNYINSIHVDRAGRLWVATAEGGLNRFERTTETFSHFVHDPANPNSLRDNCVLAILEDNSGALWLGTGRRGLHKLESNENQSHDRQTVKFKRYVCQVSAMVEDNEGMLWIGAQGLGLYRFDKAKEQFTRFVHDPNNPFSMSDAGIVSACVDRAGDLWLGTHGYGINKYSRTGKAFRHYGRTQAYPNSLANRSVRAIYEDEQGVLWIGGYDGMDRFDRRTGKITHYNYAPGKPSNLPGKEVFAIYADPASGGKTFLIGFESKQGLVKFDRATGGFTHYPSDPTSRQHLIPYPVYAIHRERSGILLIGTDAGLFTYDEAKKELRQFSHDPNNPQSLGDNRVLSLCEDATGTLWAGTEGGGLNRYERATGHFVRYQHDPGNPFSLSHDRIKCIYAARDGTLWIGTGGGGLNRFDREQEKFMHYTTKDGLPNDVVYAILEDGEGNLWLSTNKGLSKFNPQTRTFRNYEVSDGLQSNEFNTGAYFKSKSGEMFFGGINGVTAFFPDQIKENLHAPPLVFTGFKKFNQPVKLDTAIAETPKINLSYQDAVFSLEFAALSYTAPGKNQYAFQLQGFNKDWVELGTKREVTFTNLDPGEYTLRVKGSNNDGVWNEAGARVAISIAPAFYQTKWFIALCALLLGLTVYGGYRWRLRRHEAREQQLERLVAERTEALRESEAKMRAIFDNAPDFIVVIDRDHRIQFINRTVSGVEMEEVIGNNIYDYLLPEYHAKVRNSIQLVFATGRAERLESMAAGPDGKISWYLTTIAPLPREDKVHAIVMLATDITERKRAEEALKQSEDLFRMLYNNTPVMMHSLNKNGELVSVNEYWLKVMGYTREEVIGKNALSFLTETSRQDAMNVSIPRFFETGVIEKIERQWIKKSGEIIDGLLSAAPVRNKQGEIERSLAFFVDLTERKRAEQALRESETKFRTLAESITAGAFIFCGAKMRYVNSAAERISGYAREELLAMNFWEIIHPEFRTLVQERGMARQRGEPVPSRYEIKIITKPGEARWIDFTATPTEFEGKPAVLGTALDITMRKQIEEALRESEARYRALVENSPDAIFVHRDGKILYANPASARLVGAADPLQILDKSVIDFVAAEYFPMVAERLRRTMQEGIAFPAFELKGCRLDGSAIEVETRGLPIIYEGLPAVQVIVRDVTDRKQMEAQLRRHTTALESMVEERTQRIRELERQRHEGEKLAATGRMAARIAHEINNPLGMIQTAFRLVSNAIPQAHRHHHYVDKIEKEIGRIAQIVRQMLDLHKPHQESPKQFRADEAIGEVVALTKPNFHERHITCEQDLQRARQIVMLPENMLRQILYNVMLNAAEASPLGGLVRITAEIAAACLHIAVSDHGEGISAEIKDRIFDPFFTTKSNGSTGGMGLGLSICKSLIEAMKGTIKLESKPGEGTVCRIAIPLDEKETNDKAEKHA